MLLRSFQIGFLVTTWWFVDCLIDYQLPDFVKSGKCWHVQRDAREKCQEEELSASYSSYRKPIGSIPLFFCTENYKYVYGVVAYCCISLPSEATVVENATTEQRYIVPLTCNVIRPDIAGVPQSYNVPYFRINLDLPAEQRFVHVAKHFQQFAVYLPLMEGMVRSGLAKNNFTTPEALRAYLPADMMAEINGMAKALNLADEMPLVALNLAFEAAMLHCTALVVKCGWPNGTVENIHARGLQSNDGAATKFLREAVILLEFIRDGNSIYSGVSFAFAVGLLTGQRHHGYTVSVNMNFEDKTTKQERIAWLSSKEKTKMPVAYAIRQALDQLHDYSAATRFLREELMAAPAYITISGVGRWSNSTSTTIVKVMVDEPKSSLRTEMHMYDPRNPESSVSGMSLTQANNDQREQEMLHKSAKEIILEHGCNVNAVQEVLMKPPVTLPNTVFTTIMRAEVKQTMFIWTIPSVL